MQLSGVEPMAGQESAASQLSDSHSNVNTYCLPVCVCVCVCLRHTKHNAHLFIPLHSGHESNPIKRLASYRLRSLFSESPSLENARLLNKISQLLPLLLGLSIIANDHAAASVSRSRPNQNGKLCASVLRNNYTGRQRAACSCAWNCFRFA